MSKWESYQFANRLKMANHWLQVLLIFSLIIGINYLAVQNFRRYDLTENHRYALSPETCAYVKEIQKPVQVIITIPKSSQRKEEQTLYRYVTQLLQEYVYQSRKDGSFLINVEHVDIFTNLARADELARMYSVNQPNSILVLSGNNSRLIRGEEVMTFEDGNAVSFQGESVFTSAIMEVTQETIQKLYFLRGHEEVQPNDTSPQVGLSELVSQVKLRNFQVDSLDLTTQEQVPSDASVLIIADPKGPLLTSELDKIRSYLSDRAGKVIIWVRPGVEPNLFPLISNWGIRLSDQVVIEPDPGFQESKNTLLIRNFGDHEVMESLILNQTYIMTGWTRPVFPVVPDPVDERLSFIPLFASSDKSWSESAYRESAVPQYTPGADIMGPIPLAVAAERKASSQLGIKVPGGKLVVFGSPDLFSNKNISSLGNVSLFFNTLNWMLEKDQLLVIPPRPVETYQLVISQDQLNRVGLLFLAVPGVVALLGFVVYWIRQS